MLYPNFFCRFIQPVHLYLKTDKLDYLQCPMTDQIYFCNVLALENILVALTREIGNGPCFLYLKFSWIGVSILLHSILFLSLGQYFIQCQLPQL